MTCQHPVHLLAPGQRLMLETAVKVMQVALWGIHPPTVFGNSGDALAVALQLDEALHADGAERATVHHAKDGCFHLHYSPKAFGWAEHLKSCPVALDVKAAT